MLSYLDYYELDKCVKDLDDFLAKLIASNKNNKKQTSFKKNYFEKTKDNEISFIGTRERKRFEYNEQNKNRKNIKKVLFNGPATIIFWTDGTKTVAKCDNQDTYDKFTGFCIAAAKKMFGNSMTIMDIIEFLGTEEC